ncbi:unnamed protein product, partial [Ectocarpus sp. 12 AP-2014]
RVVPTPLRGRERGVTHQHQQRRPGIRSPRWRLEVWRTSYKDTRRRGCKRYRGRERGVTCSIIVLTRPSVNMHQISASSPSLATPCHHAEESDGGGGGGGG